MLKHTNHRFSIPGGVQYNNTTDQFNLNCYGGYIPFSLFFKILIQAHARNVWQGGASVELQSKQLLNIMRISSTIISKWKASESDEIKLFIQRYVNKTPKIKCFVNIIHKHDLRQSHLCSKVKILLTKWYAEKKNVKVMFIYSAIWNSAWSVWMIT